MGLLIGPIAFPAFFLILLTAAPIRQTSPSTALWAVPAILFAALMIAWAAESAQFYMAQGFALAILAWLQTLPEFASEAVFAWHQQTPLLIANLTGALRLLTGLGWPVIYLVAAIFHKRRTGSYLRAIRLEDHHSVEVIALLIPLIYMAVVCAKGVITLIDAAVLIVIYAAYLAVLRKLPPEEPESIDELELVPRTIVRSPRTIRIAAICGLFALGGGLIYFAAEPFLASLLAIATVLGIPSFVFVQWVAPLVSEFPEMASTTYFASTPERAPLALMNMVSSNINQWTLLVAMLPIVLSISAGGPTPLVMDPRQRMELLMTLGQALVGMMFLMNMELGWWEAATLLALFVIPFAHPAAAKIVTVVYFVWAGVAMVQMYRSPREPSAIVAFAEVWKKHITRAA
jgi:cation:H+ antiporter